MIENIPDIIKKEHNAPAFHYLFFSSDSVIKDVCQGYQNVENKLKVDDQTSFHAFSVSKTFTAVAIMQLVEEDKIWAATGLTHYDTEIGNGVLRSNNSGENWNDTLIGLVEPNWSIVRINRRKLATVTPSSESSGSRRGRITGSISPVGSRIVITFIA